MFSCRKKNDLNNYLHRILSNLDKKDKFSLNEDYLKTLRRIIPMISSILRERRRGQNIHLYTIYP